MTATEVAMSTNKRLPAFARFIQDLRAAWVEFPDMVARSTAGCAFPAVRAASMIMLTRGRPTAYSTVQKVSSVIAESTIDRRKVMQNWNWKASPKGNRAK